MAQQSRPRSRRIRALVIGLLAVAPAQLATAVALAVAFDVSFAEAVGSYTVTNGAMGLGFAACGGLLAWHRLRNPIGWLFLAAGVAEGTSVSAVQLYLFGAGRGWSSAALAMLGSVFILAWPLAIGLCLPMALLLFPDGRPVSPRWRWLIWAAVTEGLAFELTFAGPGRQTVHGRSRAWRCSRTRACGGGSSAPGRYWGCW